MTTCLESRTRAMYQIMLLQYLPRIYGDQDHLTMFSLSKSWLCQRKFVPLTADDTSICCFSVVCRSSFGKTTCRFSRKWPTIFYLINEQNSSRVVEIRRMSWKRASLWRFSKLQTQWRKRLRSRRQSRRFGEFPSFSTRWSANSAKRRRILATTSAIRRLFWNPNLEYFFHDFAE